MPTTSELETRLSELESRLADIHTGAEERDLGPEEQTEWDELLAERATVQTEVTARHERARIAETLTPQRGTFIPPNIQPAIPKPDELDLRTAAPGEVRDAALKHVEANVRGLGIDTDEVAKATAERHVRRDSSIARHFVQFGGEVYESAWAKAVTGRHDQLNSEERAALAVGTTTQGGFLVPTHLDPTIILTNSGIAHPYRQIAKVVTLGAGQDNSWQGVSSAGATSSWDAELAEVSDDSPTLAQPTVPTYKSQTFIQASGEVMFDASNLAEEVMTIIVDSVDRLEGAAFSTGSGSAQPTGIFTALDANTNAELANTTAATLGAVDIYAAYKTVGPRWRSRASWVMNVEVENTIRQLGTSDPNFTVNMLEAGLPRLFGKAVYEDSSAPTPSDSTTVVENWLVFGDFSNFVIVDKVGMRVQFIPFLLHTSTNFPNDTVGWHATKRVGSDSIVDTAFVVLQDKTSA